MRSLKAIFFVCGLAFLWASCDREFEAYPDGYNNQDLYEDTVSVTIDTNRFYIDYSKYTQARIFPGLVAPEEPRLEDYKVTIDLDYEYVPASWLRISVAPGDWMSTAMWAPAGELVIIDVPEGVYGLTAQIGAHTTVLAQNLDFYARDPNITSRHNLFPGRNYMRNLYGGLVYILPTRPLGMEVELSFTGTVLAPSFKLNSGMTDEAWNQLVEESTVPWFEMESDRIVFTLETAQLRNNTPVPNPTEVMEHWDKAIKEGYWDFYGLTEGNPDPRHRAPVNKWRIVHDIQMPIEGAAQVSGYPVRALWRNMSFNYFRQAVTVEGVTTQNWGTYHELGHNMQMHSTWSFNNNGEVTCNLFSFKVARTFGYKHSAVEDRWNKAQPYLAMDNKNWETMEESFSNHLDIRLAFFVQIMEMDWDLGRGGPEKSGYDFITELTIAAREARFTAGSVDQRKIDFFYEELCKYAEMDLEPYFRTGWGIFPSTQAVNRVQANGWPRLETSLWEYNPVTNTGGDNPIPRIIEDVDRSDWTATASANWDGMGASNLLDGVATTLWHAPNVSSFPPEGYILTFNSTSDIVANGFYFQNRQSFLTRNITDFRIHVRNNDTDPWEEMSFDVGNTLDGMSGVPHTDKYYIEFADRQAKTFRQFRMTIYNGTHAHVALSELGAWREEN